jgi:hypothetical protein
MEEWVQEQVERHEDFHCDCHWARPMCWHCGDEVPPCDRIFHTTVLRDSAIHLSDGIYLVLFCQECFQVKKEHYTIATYREYDHFRAYTWLSARLSSEHENHNPNQLGPSLIRAPGPPPLIIHNPEDYYDDGNITESESEEGDAAPCEHESEKEDEENIDPE